MNRIVLFLICLLVPVAAYAQQAATTVQPNTGADQTPTRQEVLQLFATMRLQKQMEQMQKTMAAQMGPMMEKMATDHGKAMTPDQRARLDSIMKSSLEDSLNMYPVAEMLNDMVPVYQNNLSKTDITAISAFYGTPAGQKLLEKGPKMMQEGMAVIMPKMQERMRKNMDSLMQKMNGVYQTPAAAKTQPNKSEGKKP